MASTMFDSFLVPVDGSPSSWRALDTALAFAAGRSARIEVLRVRFDPGDVTELEREMYDEVSHRDLGDANVACKVELSVYGIDGIVEAARRRKEALIVMASHGRGRSAAIVGSVTEGVLRGVHRPVMVVGPHVGSAFRRDHAVQTEAGSAERPAFGPVVVATDGTDAAASTVSFAVETADALGSSLWIVESLDPQQALPADIPDSADVHRLADAARRTSSVDVEFEVLHNDRPVDAVTDYAESIGAAVIVASTHARHGASRLALGSTGAGFVRRAQCPVLLIAAPEVSAP